MTCSFAGPRCDPLRLKPSDWESVSIGKERILQIQVDASACASPTNSRTRRRAVAAYGLHVRCSVLRLEAAADSAHFRAKPAWFQVYRTITRTAIPRAFHAMVSFTSFRVACRPERLRIDPHKPTYQYLSAGLVFCPGPSEAINTPKGLESFFY